MKSIRYCCRKFLFIPINILLLAAFSLSAQNETDALRYTQFLPSGTSRFSAMGGAFGALGADLSVMATNPAGTGLYRRSDVGVTTLWSNQKTQSTYYGRETENTEFSFQLANAGFIVTNPLSNNSGWKSINVGFAYNHLNDYNRDFTIAGVNPYSSLLDYQANKLNYDPSQADGNPYYEADVVFWDSASSSFLNDYRYPDNNPGANQYHNVLTEGYAGEYDINFSTNYNDVLFVGGTFSFQQIRYRQTTFHDEVPQNDLYLESFNSTDYLESRGNGFNFKMGIMAKIGHTVRLGAAFHTPINYNFRDEYWTDVYARIDYPNSGMTNTAGFSPWSEFYWEFKAPAKYMVSTAVVLGNYAIISAEAEFMNYSNMKISADYYSFEQSNRTIDTIYRITANYRIGAEFKISAVSLRAGAGYFGSPYASNQANNNAYKYLISGGAGFNILSFYFDASYQYVTGNEYYYIYSYNDSKAVLNNKSHKYTVTLGYRF